MSKFISLQRAIEMTTLYRKQQEEILQEQFRNKDILVRSETFEKTQIEALLAKKGCEKLRVYYGMDVELKIHAILVPVDINGKDILPDLQQSVESAPDEGIVDDGTRCPPLCPPPSELNP
ncbi:MAG: hypothetical protein RLZ05_715 [Bacteroidota bacterium]|jgi:hypothetical protein